MQLNVILVRTFSIIRLTFVFQSFEYILEMGEKAPKNKGFLQNLLYSIFIYIRCWVTAIPYIARQILTPQRRLKELPKRTGETAIVTGGARGIGLEITKQLLQADMNVIIACRNTSAGYKMIKQFRSKGVKTGTAECIELDLGSLQSVRKFAKIFLSKDIPLNTLINNAGIMFVPFKRTVDGFESQFQVNYLSHFLLTLLLLPALVRGGKESGRCSRVINVSSIVSISGRIEFDDLIMSKHYDRHGAYANTKLMQIVSSCYLNKRFVHDKLNIRAYSCHPGVTRTDLFDSFPLGFGKVVKLLLYLLGWTPSQGADVEVYAALSEELENRGGTFLGNCIIVNPNPQAEDSEIQTRLWEVSCNILKLDYSSQKFLSIVPDPFVIIDIE